MTLIDKIDRASVALVEKNFAEASFLNNAPYKKLLNNKIK
jgi:hypothetical protein